MNMPFAYIDPFVGYLALQLLAMAFLSVAIFFQKTKAFILGLFGGKKTMKAEAEPQEVQTVKMEGTPQESGKKAA